MKAWLIKGPVFSHEAFWPFVSLFFLQPVFRLCVQPFTLTPLLGFPGDMQLARACLWGNLLNSCGCKAAEMEDSPSKSTICRLEAKKAAGTHCLADRIGPSKVTWAGLVNGTHTLALWYDYFFRWSKTQGICLIPDLTLSKMQQVPVRFVVVLHFLTGWGGFVPWVVRSLYTAVSVWSDIKQQCGRKYFWWPSFTGVESRCAFCSMQ